MAFILIRSPNKAPPVLRLEGSTEIRPIVFFGKSIKNLRTNSSTKLDFPEPPVPVIPKTGVVDVLFFLCISDNVFLAISGKFSAEEIILAILPISLFFNLLISPFKTSPMAKSDCFTKSLIIPCKPNSRPSSGEYIRVIPYSINSLISFGRITPPPPPKILIWLAPFSFNRSNMYLKYSLCPPW